MFTTIGVALAGGMLIAIVLDALNGSERLPPLSWMAFTALPFLALALCAGLVRIQKRINMRAPQQYAPLDEGIEDR